MQLMKKPRERKGLFKKKNYVKKKLKPRQRFVVYITMCVTYSYSISVPAVFMFIPNSFILVYQRLTLSVV